MVEQWTVGLKLKCSNPVAAGIEREENEGGGRGERDKEIKQTKHECLTLSATLAQV